LTELGKSAAERMSAATSFVPVLEQPLALLWQLMSAEKTSSATCDDRPGNTIAE
jgi:hypothetical protein